MHLCKCYLGMVATCNSRAQKEETGIPRVSWLAKTSHIAEFWVYWRDPDSMNKVEGK